MKYTFTASLDIETFNAALNYVSQTVSEHGWPDWAKPYPAGTDPIVHTLFKALAIDLRANRLSGHYDDSNFFEGRFEPHVFTWEWNDQIPQRAVEKIQRAYPNHNFTAEQVLTTGA